MKPIPYSLPCHGCLPYKPGLVKFPCYIQPKLQGIRARYFMGSFYSRDNHRWNDLVVKHMVDEIKTILSGLPDDIMLDGEFYCEGKNQGWHTSNINVNLTKPTDLTPAINFHIFDFWKRKDCPTKFGIRQMILYKNKWPHLVPSYVVDKFEDLDGLHKLFVDNKYEGSVIVRSDCPYRDGRFSTKMKRKDFKDGEFRIVGMEKGSGKHLNRLGALVCETSDFKRFSVGTGFSDKQRDEFWLMYEALFDRMATIKYQELSEDGIPLITSFVSIRNYE